MAKTDKGKKAKEVSLPEPPQPARNGVGVARSGDALAGFIQAFFRDNVYPWMNELGSWTHAVNTRILAIEANQKQIAEHLGITLDKPPPGR